MFFYLFIYLSLSSTTVFSSAKSHYPFYLSQKYIILARMLIQTQGQTEEVKKTVFDFGLCVSVLVC